MTTNANTKAATRATLESMVAAFIARGGVITRLPPAPRKRRTSR
jgi:hypothetical protein